MRARESRHLYRYFAPEDRFVRILVCDPRTSPVELASAAQGHSADPGGLDRRGYQRAVVSHCIADEEAQADTADELLDELYRLAVAVNPELDIHRVSLGAPARPVPERRPGSDERREYERRLTRVARDAESRLGRRVIGQPEAVGSFARAVRRAAAGLGSGRGPLASLLLVGPTGSGKTELARSLAQELGGPERLVRIDCSEYAEGHEYARLTGAPPGYVGHEDGGHLFRALEKTPDAVVLFDEVEKAHTRLHHLLLQVLDEGRLTDGRGAVADLTRSFVVLTSNVGARELAGAERALGFERAAPDDSARREILERSLDACFAPEFLARIDETVLFRPLGGEEAVEIAKLQLADLATRVRRRQRRVRFTSAISRHVARAGLSPRNGARGIAHLVRREIEGPLADALLGHPDAEWIVVSMRGGQPRFEPGS